VHVATRRKYLIGDLLTRQVTECFGFQPDGSYSMRHLSVGHDEPLRAELTAFVRAVVTGTTPAVTGEEGVESLGIAMRCLEGRQGAMSCRSVPAAPLADPFSSSFVSVSAMNQHTRLDTTPIPFIDVAAQRRRLGSAIDVAVSRVLNHCQFLMGRRFSISRPARRFCGARYALSCASGTDALVLALMAKEIGPGDAVFCPSFTFCATAEAAALVGATPVFVDVHAESFNIDAGSLKKAIGIAKKQGLRPKAVIPVDLFGLAADHDAVAAVAKDENLFVLDDAAQGFGASYKGRKLGTFGHATATSFFPAKPLGCYGDGGAVLTDDAELLDRLKSLRVHGQGKDKYDNIRIGMTARLDTIQAAVLIEKLKIFPEEIVARDRIAQRYSAALADVAIVPASHARLHVGLGAIHHTPGAGKTRTTRRCTQGTRHPDRDLLSDPAAPAGGVQGLSGGGRRAAGDRPAL
jgi:dTDP-4-amino-4,6-dideoxygalactose transaminase